MYFSMVLSDIGLDYSLRSIAKEERKGGRRMGQFSSFH